MNDNEIFSVLVPFFRDNMAPYGVPSINVLQAFQPTTQGTPNTPTIYLYKIFDHRYGWTGREQVWNATDQEMSLVETQKMESTYQLSVTAPQDPSDKSSLTASDIANIAAMLIQSKYAIDFLKTNGLQIYRVTDIRNPNFENDRNQHEFRANFDITLTHERQFTTTEPHAEFVDVNINRI